MSTEKRCLITGCNSGIGKQTALELAKKGFEIIMLVRESEKSRLAYEEIKAINPNAKVHIYYANLASLEEIRTAARAIKTDFKSLDILINNAGVFKKKLAVSEDDFELMFAVNYLAPFLLTNMLLPLIKKGNTPRIINLSSMLYKRGSINLKSITGPRTYNADKIYAATKKMINHFTLELSHQVEKFGITVNAVHPGVVATDVMRDYSKTMQKFMLLFCSSVEKGAEASVYLASSNEIAETSGEFFNKTKLVKDALTEEGFAKKLWKKTDELLHSTLNKKKDA